MPVNHQTVVDSMRKDTDRSAHQMCTYSKYMLDIKVIFITKWLVPQKPLLNVFQSVELSFVYWRGRNKLNNETVLALHKGTPTHNYMKYLLRCDVSTAGCLVVFNRASRHLHTCVRGVPSSNLRWGTDYLELGVSWFYSVLPCKYRGIILWHDGWKSE
jgi:hypothetical protein